MNLGGRTASHEREIADRSRRKEHLGAVLVAWHVLSSTVVSPRAGATYLRQVCPARAAICRFGPRDSWRRRFAFLYFCHETGPGHEHRSSAGDVEGFF